MVQIAGEAKLVLEDAKQHANVQLESRAFPGLPLEVAPYMKHVEESVTRVYCLADCLDAAARCVCIQACSTKHVAAQDGILSLMLFLA